MKYDYSSEYEIKFYYEDGNIGFAKNKLHCPVGVVYYDLIPGNKFLDSVLCGAIINYDGSLGEVIVDGSISNLGLRCQWFSQGDFMVDGNTFRKICSDHDVKVNWANR